MMVEVLLQVLIGFDGGRGRGVAERLGFDDAQLGTSAF